MIRQGTYHTPRFGDRFVKVSTTRAGDWADAFCDLSAGNGARRARPATKWPRSSRGGSHAPSQRRTTASRLYYEEAGTGTPIVFVHEFGGNYRSWEPQMRYFSRRHRCITFAARGYPPSDVPEDVETYSQAHAGARHRRGAGRRGHRARAHRRPVDGRLRRRCISAWTVPQRALSLTVAGAGYGAEKEFEEYFRNVSLEVAEQFETQGARQFAKTYSLGASRVQFQNKDPRGWREFADLLGEHSSKGAARPCAACRRAGRRSTISKTACVR